MFKPKSLRNALTDAVPVLKANPDMMRIFIDNGKLASTLATSLSFENQYTLNVVVTDFPGDIDLILVPIQAWLRVQQADIMTTDEGRKRGFIYEADINSDDSIDLSISLLLTERTIVKEVGAELHIEHAAEPQPPEPVARPMKLYVHGELVSEWDE
ncbi:phage tail protein [Scandinavium manionii]|uniref:phage tail protein n=1 Tax=Scandinavium manionii TaxID=2926520 RepID=UPI002165D06F|nr:phage tail protein [Scandinavium manionii]MCS2150272.1 phage tail protein [Scandinavium manionii]